MENTRVIYKYPIEQLPEVVVRIPKGASILTVQAQFEQPCVWALVDPEEIETENFLFRTYGTGNKFELTANHTYIGTYQLRDGELIYHVFLVRE